MGIIGKIIVVQMVESLRNYSEFIGFSGKLKEHSMEYFVIPLKKIFL